MKQIVPIVGISKIISGYDTVVSGFDGVVSRGDGISSEALKAFKEIYLKGADIVLLSNSPLRVRTMAEKFKNVGFDLKYFRAIITAGEILHYKLKSNKNLGKKYYNLGGQLSRGIFEGLDYKAVSSLNQADFIFIGDINPNKMSAEDYNADLQAAVAMRLPLVCVGTDISSHFEGDVCLGVGAVAEQYVVLGGDILTVGKPDKNLLLYAKECFSKKNGKVLFIGDSFSSDMKAAEFLGADKLLVAKGIYIHTLGEGYIPDVQKTRELALNYNIFPDYLISGLRW